MRIEPQEKYRGLPCSYVGVGCAYEDTAEKIFTESLPEELKDDGYLTLEAANRYIRERLPVKKKVYYKRGERPTLREFLMSNTGRALVCVLGHFVYARGWDYYSFFDNEDDEVVCAWYLKNKELEKVEAARKLQTNR